MSGRRTVGGSSGRRAPRRAWGRQRRRSPRPRPSRPQGRVLPSTARGASGRHRRLEPQRLVEHRAGAGVDLERVRLAPLRYNATMSSPPGLQRRVRGHDGLQVADDLQVPTEREGDLGALGEAARRSSSNRAASAVARCSVTKSLKGSPRHRASAPRRTPAGGGARSPGRRRPPQRRSRRPHLRGEVEGVHLGRIDVRAVADTVTGDQLAGADAAERPPQRGPGSAARSSDPPAGWSRTRAGRRGRSRGSSGPA